MAEEIARAGLGRQVFYERWHVLTAIARLSATCDVTAFDVSQRASFAEVAETTLGQDRLIVRRVHQHA